MNKLPRLELTHEKSSLKNNDFIIFRNQSKSKNIKKVSKNNISTRKKSIKNKKRSKKNRKNSKLFFNLF